MKIPFIHQELYGIQPKYLFLDEVQALDKWHRFVYTLYERKRYFIFVTGSSSKLLSKEIATQLRGRAVSIDVYPFSFRELITINKIHLMKPLDLYTISTIKHLLLKHMDIGFFPDIVLENIAPKIFFKEYIDLVIYKDIIDRYGIKNRYALEFFIYSALASNTKEFSVNKIYNTLKSRNIKISKKTLYNFQKILEDIRVFFFLRKYDTSLKKIELSRPKVYSVDTGLATQFSAEKSKSRQMENLVFLEMIKRGLEPNSELFYWKDPQGSEVDFLILKRNKVEKLIQVTFATSEDEIQKREIYALIKASKIFNCKELSVITWDYEEKQKIGNRTINFIPLWKWILQQHQKTSI